MSATTLAQNLTGEAMVMAYVQDRTEYNKEQAVHQFLPLVKHIIGKMHLPESGPLKREDFLQYGIIGLLDALDRFEPHSGATFKTYAYRRIQGEIIDAIRREGNLTRDQMATASKINQAVNRLRTVFGREPNSYEVCEEADISARDFEEVQKSLSLNYMMSLDDRIYVSEEDTVTVKDTIADEDTPPPDVAAEHKDLKREMKKLIKLLPERQRLILALYYYEELTFMDIGQILGISESRVSQIHNQTLGLLRKQLEKK